VILPSPKSLRGGAAVGLALGALLLSSCGTSSSSSGDDPTTASGGSSDSASATPADPPSASVTPTSSDSASTSASTSAPASASASASGSPTGTPGCATSSLRARVAAGDGAAGSSYFQVRLTNTSQQPCSIRGFGGVSFVTSPQGDPIGAPADRVRRSETHQVVLAPGDTASATLQQVEAGNYPSAKCRPVRATGLRIYPPDQTRSLFVKHRATACRAAGVHLLSLTPYTKG